MMERELAARVIGAVIIRHLITENNARLKQVGIMKWREMALMTQIRRRANGEDQQKGQPLVGGATRIGATDDVVVYHDDDF